MPYFNGVLMRKLVLFDIDQTLIKVVKVHSKAYVEMFSEVFGINARMEDVKYDGKTFPNIVREIAALHDVGPMRIEHGMDAALQSYLRHFNAALPKDTSEFVLPGVYNLLEKISKSEHIPGILTGNSQPAAMAILKSAKLYDYFKIFAYGTEGKTRDKLVEVALAKADEKFLIKFSGKDIVIVGDSIHDIDCGKPYNAKTIAVATGSYSMKELKEHSPDFLFTDMRNADLVFEAIVK